MIDLRQLMDSRYHTKNLCGISAKDFERHILSRLGEEDHVIEKYEDPDAQRDQSVKFWWGHNQDFGTFKLPGLMGDRHIFIVSDFHDVMGAMPYDLAGKKVLDFGCWTGGTSLLLSALGASVTAVEEVRKYSLMVGFLVASFGIKNFQVCGHSLYDCEELDTDHDIVLLSGVLYHVTDPVLALRIAFNRLKPGGTCQIETAGFPCDQDTMLVKYCGPTRAIVGGTKKDRNRHGWNWFIPSEKALRQMVLDVGFEGVETRWIRSRLYCVATKGRQVDMLRAGISSRKVK